MLLLDLVSAILIVVGFGMLFYAWKMLKINQPHLVKNQNQAEPKIAILVPARDESAVITGLLKSLQNQSQPLKMEDVYVIIENENDPTVDICQKFGASIIVRKPPFKQCKGAALDEAVKEILKRDKHYDIYFIFDADNVLTPDYLEKMLISYHQGYPMATGYRMPKNGNQNLITAASALTFTMINVIGNQSRVKCHGNIIFSGTGCYVAGNLVKEWGGWPFQSLTEDYEMSLYATYKGIATYYNDQAIFYDEQPHRYRQTVLQRTRWIRGYFDARKLYLDKIHQKIKQKSRANNFGSLVREYVGVTPLILIVIGVVIELIARLVRLFFTKNMLSSIIVVTGLVVTVYVVLVIATILMLRREKTKFHQALKVKLVFYNPLYLIGYIPCAIVALLKPNITWDKIKHGDD